ncbi:chemotaxis protein CheC [Flexithrix dorotheae]|uniref:chemotaxis protein CheC n=1 Tax=Flexithrix dorotheae TaxID=70993 RepID=UPI00035C3CB7|nr:hypothetical protein [Flexithrix dorotheae]
METIDRHKQNITLEIIEKGCYKAAQAFGKMLDKNIVCNAPNVKVSTLPGLKAKGNEIHLLTTEVIGQIQAKSYLIFSEKEAEEIVRYCSKNGMGSVDFEMSIEILKEIDNILSATVITEISNHFQLKLYGDVPFHFKGTSKYIEKVISQEINEKQDKYNQVLFVAHTNFNIENNLHFKPYFFWIFSDEFMKSAC